MHTHTHTHTFDVHVHQVTALFVAAQKGRTEIVKVLLQAGADPTIEAYCLSNKERCSPFLVSYHHPKQQSN